MINFQPASDLLVDRFELLKTTLATQKTILIKVVAVALAAITLLTLQKQCAFARACVIGGAVNCHMDIRILPAAR